MPNIFHWIGSTANSESKYDWNAAQNWLKEGNVQGTVFSRVTKTPMAGDTVKIGHKFYPFSPCLFGGYSGNASSGSWQENGTTGNTVGITNGSVTVEFATDVVETVSYPAEDSWTSSNVYYFGFTGSTPIAGQDGYYWPSTVVTRLKFPLVAGTGNAPAIGTQLTHGGLWNLYTGLGDTFTFMLARANPHMSAHRRYGRNTGLTMGYSEQYTYGPLLENAPNDPTGTGARVVGKQVGKYCFPVFGYGLTGWVANHVQSVYDISFSGYEIGLSASNAAREENAWIGGGLSASSYSARAAEGLKLRIKNFKVTTDPLNPLAKGLTSFSNDQGTHANELWSEVNIVSDKDTAGYVQSQIAVNQPCVGQLIRAFKFNGGTVRKVEVVGQCNVNLSGMTASVVNTDIASFLKVEADTTIGGLRVVDTADTFLARENPYALYINGDINTTANTAVWGAAATGAGLDSSSGQLVLDTPLKWSGSTSNNANTLSNYNAPVCLFGGIGLTDSIANIPTVNVVSSTDTNFIGGKWQLHFSGNTNIQTLNDSGSQIWLASNLAKADSTIVNIGALNVKNRSIVDMRSNPTIDNIFLGGITGTGTSQRLVGGIVCGDDTVTVIPSAGVSLVNTKILFGKVDTRTSNRTGTISVNNAIQDSIQLISENPPQ